VNTVSVDSRLSSGSSPSRSGLFRAALAGRGCSLPDAFDSLERSVDAQRVLRHGRRNLFGARIPLDPMEGVGHWELTRIGSGVYVVVENFAYNHRRIELVPGDDLIQFYFKLSGDLTMELNATPPLRINRPGMLVYRQPRGVDIEEWTAASARERCVAISVERRYLAEELLSSTGEVPAMLAAFMNSDASGIQHLQAPLSAQMFELAARLVENPHDGSLGLVYTEAVTLELLCLAVSSLQGAKCAQPYERYSDRDLRSLHAARSILMKQLSPPPTIRQVARVVGINETSLKRGFKALFGETIFDFSVRCRMEHAITLLRERQMPVARVAETVGYSHQTSFASAFRRHFGICPKDARPPCAH
jgi:AraC-like DNA-binding protein